MIKVEMDCWDRCYDGTSFILELSCVPLIGETMAVHKSFFPSDYFEEEEFNDFKFEQLGLEEPDEYCKIQINYVEHAITPSGHIVRIDFDPDGYED